MTDVEPSLMASTTSTDMEVAQITGDHHVEQMISDKLMKGFTLLTGGCPVCSTPLIKNEMKSIPEDKTKSTLLSDQNNRFPIIVSSDSFDQPFLPVRRVPFCVICQAHVVTTEADVYALEASESFKEKGSILVDLKEEHDEYDFQDHDNEFEVHSNEQREQHGDNDFVKVPIFAPALPPLLALDPAEEGSEDGASSFNKSIGSIKSESTLFRNRPVDPNRFTTALFCGTTASRQQVSASPVNGEPSSAAGAAESEQQSQVPDPYNNEIEQVFEDTAFADALEEDDDEEPATTTPAVFDHRYTLGVEKITPQLVIDVGDVGESEPYEQFEHFDDEDLDTMVSEYGVRREIATKLLGTKMLEGYTLRDTQCAKCDMPLMEYDGVLECVVCPVLMHKAKAQDAILPQFVPRTPVERKAHAIEQRWKNETTVKAEEAVRQMEASLLEEARQAALEAHLREAAQATLEAHLLEVRRLEAAAVTLEACRLEAAAATLEVHRLELTESRLEAHRLDLAEARETELPLSPRAVSLASASLRGADPLSPRSFNRLPTSPRSDFSVRSRASTSLMSAGAQLLEARLFAEAQLLEQLNAAANERSVEEAIQAEMVRLDYDPIARARSPRSMSYPNTPRSDFSVLTASPRGRASTPEMSEEAQLLEARLYAETKLLEEVKSAENARQVEEAIIAQTARLKYEAIMVVEQAREAEEERKAEKERVLEETRRFELLEEKQIVEDALNNESKFREGQSLRDRAVEEDKLQRQIQVSLEGAERNALIESAETRRRVEELEMKHAIAQKKAEANDNAVAALEQDAEAKQKAAETAVANAQVALSEVSTARKDAFASMIAQAEIEAVEEAEATLEAEAEECKRSAILQQSAEDLERGRWVALRAEGRSTLTRRMMQGWKLNDDLCTGEHCRHSPIVEKYGRIECVVCGGTGTGRDGVYVVERTKTADEDEGQEKVHADKDADEVVVLDPPPTTLPLEEAGEEFKYGVDVDFETKRHLVSKEIGKRMIGGWTLLDLSCPNCVMPLMTDGQGGQETCVMCGPVTLEDEPALREAIKRDPPASARSSLPSSTRSDPPAFSSNDYEIPTDSEAKHYVEPDAEVSVPAGVSVVNAAQEDETKEALAFFGNDYKSPTDSESARRVEPDGALSLPAGVDVDDDIRSVAFAMQGDETKEELAFFGNDYESPKNSESARREDPHGAFSLPAGVDFDDDLKSVAAAMQEDEKKEAEDQFEKFNSDDPQHGTVEFTSDISVDDVSYMTGTTWNNLPMLGAKASKKPQGLKLKTSFNQAEGHSTATQKAGGRGPISPPPFSRPPSPSSNKLLPPRPGHTKERPLTAVWDGHAPRKASQSMGSSSQSVGGFPVRRRGPPRPEERGPRKSPTNTRSVSTSLDPRRSPTNTRSLSPSQRLSKTKNSGSISLSGVRDDVSIMSEGQHSRADTVASEALDAILSRIGECKAALIAGTQSGDVAKQTEMASLIEKLASAAVAVKKLEEMGVY